MWCILAVVTARSKERRARATAEVAFLHPHSHPSNHSIVHPLTSVEPPQEGLVVLCSHAFPVQQKRRPPIGSLSTLSCSFSLLAILFICACIAVQVPSRSPSRPHPFTQRLSRSAFDLFYTCDQELLRRATSASGEPRVDSKFTLFFFLGSDWSHVVHSCAL